MLSPQRMTTSVKSSLLGLAFAAALLSTSGAQTSSSTPVIGYYKFDVPVGQSAWVCGFVTKNEFQGQMTDVTAGAVDPDGSPTATISATASWTASPAQFGPLYYVEILSGPSAGRILDVKTNTSNTITVRGIVPTGNPTFCIRKHTTLDKMLPNGGGLPAYGATLTIYNESSSVVATYDGSTWIDLSTFLPASDQIIYPSQGFLIDSGYAVTLTMGGSEVSYVKNGPTRINLYSTAEQNLLGPVNPLVSLVDNEVIARSSSTNFGLPTMIEAYTETALRISLDGSYNTVAVYFTDGTDAFEISGASPATDYFRNGSAVSIFPSSSREVLVPKNFAGGN